MRPEMEKVIAEIEKVIAGKQETIDAIEFLTTEYPMSIDGASASVSGYVRLKRPAGLDNTLPTEVAVTAEIGEKNIERMLRAVDVEIEGLSSGLKASLSTPKMAVQLTGPFGFLKGLGRSDMRLYVDVSGLAAGEHIVPVQIRLNDAPEDTGAIECALSDPEVKVTISEK